jgi:branched-chain amino acid transport system permease protein
MDLQNFWDIYSNLVLTLGIHALMALSIWITLYCGMLAVANAAFMGIGAYTSALLTMSDIPYSLALASGMAAPALVAAVIGLPVIRLSGVYLAMATLAFGEVVRVIVLNTDTLTGGAMGLNNIPQFTEWWHVLLALLAVLFILWRMRVSKIGRAFDAIRGDETAAGLMGIDVRARKMQAFVIGAAIAGLAGALSAHLTFFIGPGEFGFDRGVEILTMAILGGTSGLTGPVLGSAILTLLPEVLRGLADYRLMVNGVILVVIVLFLPRGIWDPARFRRWFGGAAGGRRVRAADAAGHGGVEAADAAAVAVAVAVAPPAPAALLELTAISKNFGGLHVLRDVNLSVPEGAIYGLIGPNGAGKTTVFNLITGLLEPSSGGISFGGASLLRRKPHEITRLGIARTFQNIRLFKEMTLLENVAVGAYRHMNYGFVSLLLGLPRYRQCEARARARALELLSWMKLEHKAADLADNLSYGEQRRLELARALATEPRLLLLDEPVAGMNTGERTELMRELQHIRARGYTLLLIEHDMRFVMGLCERIAVLNFGHIIAEGGPGEIRANEQVIEAYLGRDEEEAA